MFKQIQADINILNISDFKKDEISFNLIPHLIKNKERFPDIRCYSDERDIIILNTDENHPVLIWTSERFNLFNELFCFLNQRFKNNKTLSLITKKEVYELFLKQNKVIHDDKKDILGVYRCKTLKPVQTNGTLDFAKETELDIIANMLQAFVLEAQPNEHPPLDYYQKEALKFITQSDFYKVWKNKEGEIVSIGRVEFVGELARIGRIYTLPKHRGHSYAKMLVQELAHIGLKKGLMPVLYTNFQYEPSNKCYQAIGFEHLNTIYTYEIKKEG